MSVRNIFSRAFLASLAPEDREQLDRWGESTVRAHIQKLLPETWTLSKERITVVVDYDDPRWSAIPKQGGVYAYVNPDLTQEDLPKGEYTGKWEVTFLWFQKPGGWTTTEAWEAIATRSFPSANRAETESVIDAHPNKWWVGLGDPQSDGLPVVYDDSNGKRALGLDSGDYWGDNRRFLVCCGRRRLSASPFSWLCRLFNKNPTH